MHASGAHEPEADTRIFTVLPCFTQYTAGLGLHFGFIKMTFHSIELFGAINIIDDVNKFARDWLYA